MITKNECQMVRLDFDGHKYRVKGTYYGPEQYVIDPPGEFEIECILLSENGAWTSPTWIDCTRRLETNPNFLAACLRAIRGEDDMDCTCTTEVTCPAHKDLDGSGWIQTFTGLAVNPALITPGVITIADIAHALAMQCRFSGHVNFFYSVAQHSIHVSQNCEPKDALWGLLHDAAEAYLVDLPRPIKYRAGYETYRKDEARVMQAVCERFSLTSDMPESVRQADELLLTTEARDFMAPLRPGWRHTEQNGYPVLPAKLLPWTWQHAEQRFLQRFRDLQRQHMLSVAV